MNKTTLRSFATTAREQLLERVQIQARKIGITNDNIQSASFESSDAIFIDGEQLTDEERIQRNKLIARINEVGFERVIEETAYTWFNRFIALRYMEVNDYLPTKVRVLSSEKSGNETPDILEEVLSLDLPIDKQYVYDLKVNNQTDELFKYLIKLHCNDLNRYLPFMFETIEDYMLILFPEGLLNTESFLKEMTNPEFIPETDWQNIEIIGWLYQFYIADEKDRVFKQKGQYSAEEIPFATQLFTPEWIVRYMVQNSLGKYWLEAHPEQHELKKEWEFYLAHDESYFNENIAPYINKSINIEDVKCFDPAMGSGHILVYMFDVLYEIYSKNGYLSREIPRLIIENNLYGLDIDDRAYQLASFSIIMKALQYNRRFLRTIERDGLQLNLAAIQETNCLNEEEIAYIAGENTGENFAEVKQFVEQFHDAKSLGSLIKLTNNNYELLKNRLKLLKEDNIESLFAVEKHTQLLNLLPKLIKQAEIIGGKYDIIVTNPPYMGSSGMNKQLTKYLRKHYPDSQRDLFSAFMELDHNLKDNGFYAAINQHSWMFLSSYEKLRKKIVKYKTIDTMLHLGPRAFEEIGGEVVQSTAFVLRNRQDNQGEGIYVRLIDERTATDKRKMAINAVKNKTVPYRYNFKQQNYEKVSGSPIVYWISEQMIELFKHNDQLEEQVERITKGIFTGANARFIRYWYEVNDYDIQDGNWNKYSKGGGYRKWYGNQSFVVNWRDDAKELREFKGSGLGASQYFNMEHFVWSKISTNNISFRYDEKDVFFDDASPAVLFADEPDLALLGMLNSKVTKAMLALLSPTMNFQIGDIKKLPINTDIGAKREQVEQLVTDCIQISKADWNATETSWDFEKHPFLKFKTTTIEQSFNKWQQYTEEQIERLRQNERHLNEVFINLYNLAGEVTADVNTEEIVLQRANLEDDIKSFISYAVGCLFGRYSLDEEGLVFAGGTFNNDKYKTIPADENNILPILADTFFTDDIVTKFVQFVEKVYSAETLTENIQFIASALGQRRNETAQETIQRYFLRDFYKDHVRTYNKCPIYWHFTSGRERAFNCLIYIHRYDKTTLSRIRTDYLHQVQTRYEVERDDLLAIINSEATAKEISDAKRSLTAIDRKIAELKKYDEKLHHLADMQIEIDLNDGVQANYRKFKDILSRL